MNSIIKKLLPNEKLQYGVVYVLVPETLDYNSLESEIESIYVLIRKITRFEIKVIESPDVDDLTLLALRFNIGNSGKLASTIIRLPSEELHQNVYIKHFINNITDVMSQSMGDLLIEGFPGPRSSPRNVKRSAILHSRRLPDSRVYSMGMDSAAFIENRETTLSEKEDIEIDNIEKDKQDALNAIRAQILDYVTRFHADPSQLIQTLLEGKIVIGNKDNLSPIVVNNDLKIVLPSYNEVEVKMPAMCRAIYILFLKNHEGIALRDIANYRHDIENIYSMVMPGRKEKRARQAIDNLLDPMSNTLNEYISKIKRCLKSCILNEELLNHYCITGRRGEPYRIDIDHSLITLPRAVTMDEE